MPSQGVTKQIIAGTMKKHMEMRPLSKISVSDIVQACGLNRNSFYYHFKDKYDLVNWIFATDLFEAIQDVELEDDGDYIAFLCHFLYDERKFYRNALLERGQNSCYDCILETIKDVSRERLSEVFAGQSREACISLLVEALLHIIVKWLLGDPDLAPDEFLDLLKMSLYGGAVFSMNTLLSP